MCRDVLALYVTRVVCLALRPLLACGRALGCATLFGTKAEIFSPFSYAAERYVVLVAEAGDQKWPHAALAVEEEIIVAGRVFAQQHGLLGVIAMAGGRGR